MDSSIVEPKISDLCVTESEITVYLMDGRTVSVPLAWSWRLSEATPEQHNHWVLIGDGIGIHWPEVDEDISIGHVVWRSCAKAADTGVTRDCMYIAVCATGWKISLGYGLSA